MTDDQMRMAFEAWWKSRKPATSIKDDPFAAYQAGRADQQSQPMPPEISRGLLGKIVDEVFDGAIEDASVIGDIYRVVARECALQSQDREDAEWMACDSRRSWVANSLKERAKDLRDAEKRGRRAFNKDYMGEPARYFADACGEAAAAFEAKLNAIDHARRIEGEGK